LKPNGTGLRKLTGRLPGINSPRWSPSGTRIAFVRDAGYRSSPKAPVYVVRVDGSRLRAVGLGHSPRWSPDGRRLMFMDVHGLRVSPTGPRPPATGRIVVVDIGSGRRSVIGRGETPSWSPDGKRVAFVRYAYFRQHGWDVSASTLLTMRADGSGVRVIKARGSEGQLHPFYDPEWSPDGRTIAFWVEDVAGTGGGSGLQLIDVTTGVTRRLVPGGRGPVEWSPDGKRVVFIAYEHGLPNVATVDVQTTDVKVLAHGEVLGSVRWSPNGEQIGFLRCFYDPEYRCYAYSVNANGSRLRRLVQTSAEHPLEAFDWGRS
jgi:Tol biopolymer transport system component